MGVLFFDSKGRGYNEDQIAAIQAELEARALTDINHTVAKLREAGVLIDVMRAACEIYGLQLVLDDKVEHTLRAEMKP